MPSSVIKSVTFDCDDALVVAPFWATALGTGGTVVRVGNDLTVMQDPGGNEFCVE